VILVAGGTGRRGTTVVGLLIHRGQRRNLTDVPPTTTAEVAGTGWVRHRPDVTSGWPGRGSAGGEGIGSLTGSLAHGVEPAGGTPHWPARTAGTATAS
jgi:hypothetical protein